MVNTTQYHALFGYAIIADKQLIMKNFLSSSRENLLVPILIFMTKEKLTNFIESKGQTILQSNYVKFPQKAFMTFNLRTKT